MLEPAGDPRAATKAARQSDAHKLKVDPSDILQHVFVHLSVLSHAFELSLVRDMLARNELRDRTPMREAILYQIPAWQQGASAECDAQLAMPFSDGFGVKLRLPKVHLESGSKFGSSSL
mmetsp:Transcript_86390/g.278991  ORF Transcript_86390/g.278991 Transcript_86390/m.278991 type:complete len:119 (-) Transcript_86390:101-457(-)